MRSTLTAREAQILSLAAEGYTNREIAVKLTLHIQTVKNHLNAGYRKLGVCNRRQLISELGISEQDKQPVPPLEKARLPVQTES